MTEASRPPASSASFSEEKIYPTSAQELVPLIERALEEEEPSDDMSTVPDILYGLHASEVAKIIQYLSVSLRTKLIQSMRPHLDPEILTFLDDTVRDEVLSLLNTSELAAAVSDLESDDAFSVLEDLDVDQQHEVLQSISSEDRAILEEVLSYPEDSAGRLMQREVVTVPSFWTVGQTLDYIAKNEDLPDIFYDIFVADPRHHPLGVVPINKLLKTAHTTNILDITHTDIHKIPVTLDQEEVALVFRQYSLVSSPVVDKNGRIVGMITVDDVVHVIDEEAAEDIMHLAGVSESDFYAPILFTSFSRIQWLLVTLMNTLLASAVIFQFQLTLEKKVALAVLMPIVAAMGGNSGMQVVTVTVRALATRELGTVNMLRTVVKELSVAALNGVIFALILGSVAAIWFQDSALGCVLGSALIFNMLWAGLAGTMLPILIARFGMDPALSAGPLLTTTTDVLGFAVFLGLSTLFLVG